MAILKEEGNVMIEETVQRAFDKIIEERVDISWKELQDNPEYLEADTRARELMDRLMDSLQTEEQKDLLFDLESVWNLAESYFIEYSYRQDLEDGPVIYRELNKVLGISIAEVSGSQEKELKA